MPWNPSAYLAFGDHRTRPVHELLARVPLEAPARIADLGCGPGNSTAAIAARWPNAHIAGLDNSREMLARAYSEMMRKHDLIPADSPFRQSFLENIALHRQIRAAYEAAATSNGAHP